MTRQCPEGHEVDEGQRFCGECGAAVVADAEDGLDPEGVAKVSGGVGKNWVLPVVAGLAVVGVGFGIYSAVKGDTSVAAKACRELEAEDVSIAKARGIADRYLLEAIIAGSEDPAGELEAKCDIGTIALGAAGAGQLREDVDVKLGTCDSDSIQGTARNNALVAVDIRISYELTDRSKNRVDSGSVFVDDVRPGQRANWKQSLFTDGYTNCSISVESVLPAS